jgi:hypothetical protein
MALTTFTCKNYSVLSVYVAGSETIYLRDNNNPTVNFKSTIGDYIEINFNKWGYAYGDTVTIQIECSDLDNVTRFEGRSNWENPFYDVDLSDLKYIPNFYIYGKTVNSLTIGEKFNSFSFVMEYTNLTSIDLSEVDDIYYCEIQYNFSLESILFKQNGTINGSGLYVVANKITELDFSPLQSITLTSHLYLHQNYLMENIKWPQDSVSVQGIFYFQNNPSLLTLDLRKFTDLGNQIVGSTCANLETIYWPNTLNSAYDTNALTLQTCQSLKGTVDLSGMKFSVNATVDLSNCREIDDLLLPDGAELALITMNGCYNFSGNLDVSNLGNSRDFRLYYTYKMNKFIGPPNTSAADNLQVVRSGVKEIDISGCSNGFDLFYIQYCPNLETLAMPTSTFTITGAIDIFSLPLQEIDLSNADLNYNNDNFRIYNNTLMTSFKSPQNTANTEIGYVEFVGNSLVEDLDLSFVTNGCRRFRITENNELRNITYPTPIVSTQYTDIVVVERNPYLESIDLTWMNFATIGTTTISLYIVENRSLKTVQWPDLSNVDYSFQMLIEGNQELEDVDISTLPANMNRIHQITINGNYKIKNVIFPTITLSTGITSVIDVYYNMELEEFDMSAVTVASMTNTFSIRNHPNLTSIKLPTVTAQYALNFTIKDAPITSLDLTNFNLYFNGTNRVFDFQGLKALPESGFQHILDHLSTRLGTGTNRQLQLQDNNLTPTEISNLQASASWTTITANGVTITI